MESTQTTLETKLLQLENAVARTDDILESESEEIIERHLSALKTLVSEADLHKRTLEGYKIEAKEDLGAIKQWYSSVDAQINEADQAAKRLKIVLEGYREDAVKRKHEKELEFERKLFEAKLKFQTELQLAKEQQETEFQVKLADQSNGGGIKAAQPAKLPKLHIARFDGSYEDWPRFWSQFLEMIDRAEMPNVTKFAYLKSYLDYKVKKCRRPSVFERGI